MITISSLNAPIATNKVSMFKLTIEVEFNDYFRLIQAKSLALEMIISVTFSLGHPVDTIQCNIILWLKRKRENTPNCSSMDSIKGSS